MCIGGRGIDMEKEESGGIAKTNFFHYVTNELITGLFSQWKAMGSEYPPKHINTLTFF